MLCAVFHLQVHMDPEITAWEGLLIGSSEFDRLHIRAPAFRGHKFPIDEAHLCARVHQYLQGGKLIEGIPHPHGHLKAQLVRWAVVCADRSDHVGGWLGGVLWG